MGSNIPQLPVIYLSDQTLKPGSSKWVEVRSDVRKALEDYGCFEVSYDRVSVELKKSVLKAMEELFDLPVEAKQRNVSPKPYTGYSTHNGLSESLGIQDSDVLEKVKDFVQLLRPDSEDNNNISITIQNISEKLAELDVMVRRMVMESFGIDKYFDEHLDSTNYRLRLMKYVAPPDVDDKVEVVANDHVDGVINNNTDSNVDIGDFDRINVTTNVGDGDNTNVGDDTNVINNVDAKNNAHADDDDVNLGANDGDDANSGDSISIKSNVESSNGFTIGINDVNGDAKVGADININTKVNVNVGTNDDANTNTNTNDGVKVNGDGDGDVEEKKLGLPSHTDKNLFTILYQYEIEGLEVKTKDEKWIRLKPSHNSFVVIAGDSLHALMNGRISPPFHRVRVTEKKKTRYSIALFSTPKADYIIEPPKELVDEKHPRVFRPFTYVDLMSFYHTEAGRRAQSTLHAYCGVSRT